MTPDGLRWLAGLALLLLGWSLTRYVAGTRWRFSPALAVDLVLPTLIFFVAAALSARPLLAGLVTLMAGAGWARADHDKRRVLAEPVVYTDVFQAFDIFRHPQLALPFPHKAPVLCAAAITIATFGLVLWLEPPQWSYWQGLLAFVIVAGLVLPMGRTLLPLLYRGFRERALSGDPVRDTAAHGSLACLIFYSLFARSERATRRAALPPAVLPVALGGGPLVLVQNESFFDARRLHPGIPRNLLPHFDRACRDGLQWGRFAVPSWGANTVRTEFGVLTGVVESALGFDRFNPYYRFADAPMPSLARTLRAAGYHTVCLHPFDRRFYRRDQVMSQLGFDEFLGEELFPDAERINGYVTDAEVARVAASLLREKGPKLFLFVITIENHGPWSGPPDPRVGDLSDLPLTASERLSLNHYLESLINADAMLGALRSALESLPLPGVLGFYGDHLPSFPTLFPKLGLKGSESDYVIWRSGLGRGEQKVLSAQRLGRAVLDAAAANVPEPAGQSSPSVHLLHNSADRRHVGRELF